MKGSASRIVPLVAVLVLASGCAPVALGAMAPAGPISAAQRQLFITLAIVLTAVAGPVLVLTPLIAWHYRQSNKHKAFRPNWDFSWWLEALIWLPPAGIVVGLSVLLWNYTHRLDPYKPLPAAMPALQVQAVALDWKWLFIYPEAGVASVNELDIPVGRPVQISLTSATVMQSLLIPRLAGQIYAMPGMRTTLNLAASRGGRYRGANVQYNGPGFASETFDVVALPADAFQRRLGQLRGLRRPLDQTAYAQLLAPGVELRPEYFSELPAGLFDAIVSRPPAPVNRAAQ